MIEAYFVTSSSVTIPVLMPNEEVRELAALAQMSPQDLFSIDIPAGASREARAKVLIGQENLSTLYASTTNGSASVTLCWREDSTATLKQIVMWLMPPRPLFMVAGAAGIAVVEAVDVRWWWKQTQLDAENASPVVTSLYSSDGRWRTGGNTDVGTTPTNIIDAIKAMLPIGTFTSSAYTTTPTIYPRIAEYVFTPEMSLAMAIDIILSSTGYVLSWASTGSVLTVIEIKSDESALNGVMTANKRASAGGLEATSGTATASEPLLALWQGSANWQVNRMPDKVTVSFPYRSTEAKTYYDNALTPLASDVVEFAMQREFGKKVTLSTTRTRTAIGSSRVLKEPRSLIASLNTTRANPAVPSTNIFSTSPPGWNYTDYIPYVTDLLKKRCEVSYGTTVWAGWPSLFNGVYRASVYRFTIGYRSGQMHPVTITSARMDDWILGPDGMQPNDPRDMVMSKGLAHARRLGSGVMQIDVAPPYCRVFLAKITASERIGGSGNDFWKWLYSYQEVEPNPDANTPMSVSIGGWARSGSIAARNMMESANVYVSAGNISNFIAPGVSQSDYTGSTISAIPIAVNSLVLMVEQFPTAYLGTNGGATPQFDTEVWFSVPNAVKVTCNQGG